jgi:hypothetical protein
MTALRRLAGAVVAILFVDAFTSVLLPDGQLGIAVKVGMDFIVHAAHCQFDTTLQTPIGKGATPSRAGLSTDLVNCWNSVLRKATTDSLKDDSLLTPILP